MNGKKSSYTDENLHRRDTLHGGEGGRKGGTGGFSKGRLKIDTPIRGKGPIRKEEKKNCLSLQKKGIFSSWYRKERREKKAVWARREIFLR